MIFLFSSSQNEIVIFSLSASYPSSCFSFGSWTWGVRRSKPKTSNVVGANFLSTPVELELLLQGSLIEAILT